MSRINRKRLAILEEKASASVISKKYPNHYPSPEQMAELVKTPEYRWFYGEEEVTPYAAKTTVQP